MKHDDLIRRLCEASEGNAELSSKTWEALTGDAHFVHHDEDVGFVVMRRGEDTYFSVPCLTTDLSAAWRAAKARSKGFSVDTDGKSVSVFLEWDANGRLVDMYGKHEACTLCAALLAAEGER